MAGGDGLVVDDLAELAAAEWGVSPLIFWDDEPSVDRDHRLSFRRLSGYLEAYERRRQRELRELGGVLAFAFHEPSRLSAVFADDGATTARGDFESDRWW